MLEDFKEPAPEGAELEAFLAAPKHHLARLIRDLFAEEASATTMEVGMAPGQILFYCFIMYSSSHDPNSIHPRPQAVKDLSAP